ncbi:MAG: hypothetical protein AAF267_01190 [Deinococcota bacterium]
MNQYRYFCKSLGLTFAIVLCLTAVQQGYADTYAGLSFGLPTLSAYLGFQDDVAGGDLRVRVGADLYDDFELDIGVDLLFDIAQLAPNIDVYVGVGPEISFFEEENISFFGLGAMGTVGLEYAFSEQLAVFAEAGGAARYGFATEGVTANDSGIGDASDGFYSRFRATLGVLFYF